MNDINHNFLRDNREMLATEIAPNLTKIFKQSLNKAKNPNDWKIQYITPILKPGQDKLHTGRFQ